MRIVLAMIVKDEEAMLKQTLPVIAPCFRHKIAFDTGSTDNTIGQLNRHGFKTMSYDWKWDFGTCRNDLIEYARRQQFDWLFFLDADEAMFPTDISRAKDCTDIGDALGFPRYNLIYDHQHWQAFTYPDIQNRFINLHSKWGYMNILHETLVHPEGAKTVTLSDMHIFHYGMVKPIKEAWLKHHNYGLLKKGQSPLTALPDSIKEMTDKTFFEVYCSAQPAPDEFTKPNPLGQ